LTTRANCITRQRIGAKSETNHVHNHTQGSILKRRRRKSKGKPAKDGETPKDGEGALPKKGRRKKQVKSAAVVDEDELAVPEPDAMEVDSEPAIPPPESSLFSMLPWV